MKRQVLLILMTLISLASFGQRTGIELPAPIKGEQMVKKKTYTASYNKETKCPNWVAWHLTAEHVDDVERITGLDFFPSLPDEIENAVEAKANIEDWR